jgi:leucyl aminopeptidase
MSPFRPVGDRPRWRVIYDLLRKLNVGDLLSYEEMGHALDLDADTDRLTIQLAMRRAARELEVVDKHAVDAVTNQGYRIVEPNEQAHLARRHQRKANRSLARGQSKVVNVDFNQIDPETRKAFEIMAGAFAAQIDFNRRMDVRQRNLEKAVEAVSARTEEKALRTDEELAELRARLRRLEERRTSESA